MQQGRFSVRLSHHNLPVRHKSDKAAFVASGCVLCIFKNLIACMSCAIIIV